MLLSMLGTFGGSNLISAPLDMILVVVASLVCYFWGVNASLNIPAITDEDEENNATGGNVSSHYAHN